MKKAFGPRGLIIILLISLLICALCPMAAAEYWWEGLEQTWWEGREEDWTDGKLCSMTLTYAIQDAEKKIVPCTDAQLAIYRIGDYNGGEEIRLLSAYESSGIESFPVDLPKGDNEAVEQRQRVCSSVEPIILRDKIEPTAVGTVDEDGHVRFEGLAAGAYLIRGYGKDFYYKDHYYEPVTCLLIVPWHIMQTALSEVKDRWVYDIEAFLKYLEFDTSKAEVKVVKKWDDNNNRDGKRPASVQFNLYCDDSLFETVSLSEKDGWTKTWTGLEAGHRWRIAEVKVASYKTEYNSVPFEIKVSSTVTCYSFEIKNTYVPTVPQTGQLWWPVPMLILGGLVVAMLGGYFWYVSSHSVKGKRKKSL